MTIEIIALLLCPRFGWKGLSHCNSLNPTTTLCNDNSMALFYRWGDGNWGRLSSPSGHQLESWKARIWNQTVTQQLALLTFSLCIWCFLKRSLWRFLSVVHSQLYTFFFIESSPKHPRKKLGLMVKLSAFTSEKTQKCPNYFVLKPYQGL